MRGAAPSFGNWLRETIRMFSLITSLLRPYRASLAAILVAMLAQTAMSVAAPWPLKVVLDNVVGVHHLPPRVAAFLQPFLSEGNKMSIAAVAAIATVLIALLGAIASYLGNYYTTSVGQWVANDLRMRTYHHLQQLSLRYYNEHDTGTLLSTITRGSTDDPGVRFLFHAGDTG